MRKIVIIGAVLLVLPCATFAIDCPIPDTGQTKCYNNEFEMACPQNGEPFYGQDTQYVCNRQSYTKLDDDGNPLPSSSPIWNMVRDNVTGLIWENKIDDDSIHDWYNSYNWYDAQSVFIATLNNNNFGGYADWRLPTIKELMFIVKRNMFMPPINEDYFSNTLTSHYWSSTTYAFDPNLAKAVLFIDGFLGALNKSSFYRYVRAVRGGQCGSFDDFVDNGDGTVTDNNTGLMWQKDTAPGNYTWEEALSYCENLIHADYDDWRLPNINELDSIVDYSRIFPAIDPVFSMPPDVYPRFWSSTTFAGNLGAALSISFSSGDVINYGKTLSSLDKYVRAVRGGQCESLEDSDVDGIPDDQDNCPNHPNGSLLGTCTSGPQGFIGMQTCLSHTECDPNGFCSMNQEDNYPPGGNDIGDACECEGDLDKDKDVDADDVTKFLEDFGREPSYKPCP